MADNDGVNDGREAYRSDDIQGDVLPGFRRRDDDGFEQRFLLMRITGTADEARAGLRALLDRVSSGAAVDRSRDRQERAFVNVAFTASGLGQLLEHGIAHGPFADGLAARSEQENLLGDPSGWTIGRPDEPVDVLVNIGSRVAGQIGNAAAEALGRLGAAYTRVHEEKGELLPEGREHFGFRDGLAQPFASSGGATWPNWAALALRKQAAEADRRAEESAKAATAAEEAVAQLSRGITTVPTRLDRARGEATTARQQATDHRQEADELRTDYERQSGRRVSMRRPGVPMVAVEQFVLGGDDPLTRNGSYMVWLKLEQRPEEFRAMCQQLAKRLSLAWKRAVDEDEAGALLVGRDADGAPLAPSSSDQPDNFSYFDDPSGRHCPAGAHIRLANPRDVDTVAAMILRRGITYGSPDTERGLLFVCYQADIAAQYERIQGRFANARYEAAPPPSRFPDALISQRGRDGSTVEFMNPDGRGSVGTRLNNTWVVPRGGLYLFVPSMTALRALCT